MSVIRFISRGGTEYNPETGAIRQLFRGKSTDTKPKTGVNAYDLFAEQDTSDIYFWDPDINDWALMGV